MEAIAVYSVHRVLVAARKISSLLSATRLSALCASAGTRFGPLQEAIMTRMRGKIKEEPRLMTVRITTTTKT